MEHIDRGEAERIAERAVEGVLERLGVDTKDPIQAQADFAKLRSLRRLMDDDEFQLDLAFMRRWRTNTDKITDTGIRAVAKWMVLGILAMLVLGTKDWWIKHITG